jgi:MFS family permease
MKSTTRIQLSVMMFLQFFLWGGWFVTLGTFLGTNLKADGDSIGSVFSTQSWGAIIAPFIIGLIADRFFNAEKILGVLHLAGAALMYMMYTSDDIKAFYPYVFVYMVLYMPTLALVNSVSFNQLKNPEKEFSGIRVWGTIGWIVAGLLISYLFHWDSKENIENGLLKNTFLLSGGAAAVLGSDELHFTQNTSYKKSRRKSERGSDHRIGCTETAEGSEFPFVLCCLHPYLYPSCLLLSECESFSDRNRHGKPDR